MVKHFAQIDGNNRVIQVITLDESHGMDENNNYSETKAVEYINNKLYAGQNLIWKETWPDESQRNVYADITATYDEANDRFIAPKPHVSWTLDENGKWQAPVAYPTIITYDFNGQETYYEIDWNETDQRWDGIKRDVIDGANTASSWIWNATTLNWEQVI